MLAIMLIKPNGEFWI